MKNERHAEIIRLIGKYQIETQEELADKLNEEGFQVTQATVSRDIRQLQLTKVSDGSGRSRYSVHQQEGKSLSEKYVRVLRDAFASMDVAGHLLVMKTVSGMAMAAGAAMDALEWPEVLGCIAGDDTIVCVIKTEADAKKVMMKLEKIVE
ncbi:MAG: arginine repressor [Lachnospiraceae bacterium]|nr:arginine repressor [Lachnospiraceae bacterium]